MFTESAGEDELEKIDELLNKIVYGKLGRIYSINEEEIDKLTKEEKELVARVADFDTRFSISYDDKNHFLNDFENYQHGIMSAFILEKNLGAFQDVSYSPSGEVSVSEASADSFEKMMMLNEILKSISYHTSEGYRIERVNEDSFLTLVDELEEFSRISRASQNREYVKEFCETSLEMDEEGWLNILFEFHNDDLDNLNPEISFKGRCKRFLSLFDIPKMSSNLKIRVSCVGRLASDNNVYVLEIANHHADIIINGVSQDIPKYLKSNQFFTKEEYQTMK